MSAILAFEGLAKDWYGVPAVRDLTLGVEEGGALGLIGENGAGKSTLMNMVGGVVTPSAGSMRWRGEAYAPASPADATARGIAFIHQELNLFTNLSIAENVFIDGFPRRLGLMDRKRIAEVTRDFMDRLNLDHAPETAVGDLAPGERQLVEIAKALHRSADLIIFDQPTTSLTPRETYIIMRRRLSEEPLTLEALGDELGVSKERVRQVEHQALSKLKRALASR